MNQSSPAVMSRRGRRPGAVFVLVGTLAGAGTMVAPGSAAGPAPAPSIPAPSRITAVTVHLERARITREADIVLEAGEQHILLEPLPASLDTGSVRVSGRGIEGLTIRGVELRQVVGAPEETPAMAGLEAEIGDLARRSALVLERKRSLGVLREFVTGLKAAAVETSSRDLLTRGFAVSDWESAFGFLSAHLDRLAEEEDRVDHDYAGLSRQLENARARFAESASRRAPEHFAAQVLVSATRAGAARLALNYLVAGASWTPLYDARLHPAAARVTLDWLALVRQETGEDWNDAAITLTTSQPQKGIDLPRLASLRLVDPARRAQGGFVTIADGTSTNLPSEYIDRLPILARNYQDVLLLAPGLADSDGGRPAGSRTAGARDVPAGGVVGGVVGGVIGGVLGGVAGGLVGDSAAADAADVDVPLAEAVALGGARSMTFALPGSLSIPSDGRWHQQLITSRDAGAGIEYHCVPALAGEVFLVARLTLPDDLTLLPGRMAHFVDGDLVGRSIVAPRSGGEELTLSFGPESRVRATRRDVALRTARRGRDEERDRTLVTTLTNHLGRPVTIRLADRVPVSGDDRVTVTIDRDGTTPGLAPDPREPGILRWEVDLPAAGSADVTLRYRIRAPAGMLPAEP